MATRYSNRQITNKSFEEKVNKMFKEKRELENLVKDQEMQVEASMSGESSLELQALSREIGSLESQCLNLRARTGGLQGKTRDELLQMAKEATVAIGDTEKALQDEQMAFSYVQ
jgi:intraflagellar transport protein 74